MSNEAVRRKILVVTGELNVPLNCRLSRKKASSICDAVKFIRHRIIREHNHVTRNIDDICQDQWNNDDEAWDSLESGVKGTSRDEFLFIADLMVLEKLVLPLLLAHGLNHPDSLLPQLLKLITAMLLPVPRFSQKETLQKDVLAKLKQRCCTDEIMSFLVQVVAPIAEKRKMDNIERDDVVLLEVVLNLFSVLLHGMNENIIGSFSRNHGVEMLLVVINQNFAKKVSSDSVFPKKEPITSQGELVLPPQEVVVSSENNLEEEKEEVTENRDSVVPINADLKENESSIPPVKNVELTDSGSDNDLVITNLPESMEKKLEAEMHEKEHDLVLESENRLWKWNKLIASCIASVLAASPGEELAQWSLLLQQSNGSFDKISVQRNSEALKACAKERERWKHIARSRSGPMASNALFVRRDAQKNIPMYAVGTVSTLVGGSTHRKDSLEALRIMDSRKRGRFIKGMFQDTKPKCSLPIETQLELSKQVLSFFLYGFEPLTTMMWAKLRDFEKQLTDASREYKESRAGYKNSDEEMCSFSPLTAEMYESLHTVLDNMSICGTFLRFMREMVCYHVNAIHDKGNEDSPLRNPTPFTSSSPLSSLVNSLWQCLSVVISVDRFAHVFTILQLFLICKDMRRRTDIGIPIRFATELLLALQLLMEGKVYKEAVVQTAAHALASTILYQQEITKTLFDVIGSLSNYSMSFLQARSLTLFAYAALQLVEACSFRGRLFIPNAKDKARKALRKEQAEDKIEERHQRQEELGKVSDLQDETMKADNELLEMLEMSNAKHMGGGGAREENEEPLGEEGIESGATPSERRTSSFSVNRDGSGEAALLMGSAAEETIQYSPQEGGHPSASSAATDEEKKSLPPDTSDEEEVGLEEEAREVDDTVSEAPSSVSRFSQSSFATTSSVMESEQEISLQQLLQRLGSPKHICLLLITLRHWRTNDADINLALVFLMQAMVKQGGCDGAFFSVPFLLVMREILVYGRVTHGPLYKVCDDLVFDFFNPAYAHRQTEQYALRTESKPSERQTGAQSFVGFEVALRCARALFTLGPSDYSILEEKGLSYLQDHTVIPLPPTYTTSPSLPEGDDGSSYCTASRAQTPPPPPAAELPASLPRSPCTSSASSSFVSVPPPIPISEDVPRVNLKGQENLLLHDPANVVPFISDVKPTALPPLSSLTSCTPPFEAAKDSLTEDEREESRPCKVAKGENISSN